MEREGLLAARALQHARDDCPSRWAGSVGYWEHAEEATTVWETGWAILPEFQGRGLATAAVREVAKVAAAAGRHSALHAYPGVTNDASNALCRKAGFRLLGDRDFEYPKGHWMRCNDWALDLRGER